MHRSSDQAEASRRNGRKSRGPVTEAGKRIASRSAIKHGALAKVHRPPGEPPEVLESMVEKISLALCPQNDAEMEIVSGVAKDLVRVQRVQAVIEAASDLAMDRASEAEVELSDQISKLRATAEMWEVLAGRSAELRHLSRIDIVGRLRELAMALDATASDLTNSHRGSEADSVVGESKRLRYNTSLLLQHPDVGIDYNALESLYRDTALTQASRYREELELLDEKRAHRLKLHEQMAMIPEDKLLRRTDRYLKMTQGTILRQIEIIKGLRSLSDTPADGDT